jgi:hypothetical protein
VSRSDFMASLVEYARATENYFHEMDETSVMLRKCSLRPLSFEDRLELLAQEILERDAFRVYLASKRFLRRAALLGYDGLATDCSLNHYPMTEDELPHHNGFHCGSHPARLD